MAWCDRRAMAGANALARRLWKASWAKPPVERPLGRGNDGIALLVSLVPGAIGHLEHTCAQQRPDRISFGLVQNSAGNDVVPDAASFQAAASRADCSAENDFHLVLTDAPGEDATTFVLMPKTQDIPSGPQPPSTSSAGYSRAASPRPRR